MYNKPVVCYFSEINYFCDLVNSFQWSNRWNAFIQTLMAAVIKKPHHGTLGSPLRTLTVVETCHFAAKRHTMCCWGLNKMMLYPSMFDSTVLLWFLILFKLYLKSQFKHSQILHESTVEARPCRKPAWYIQVFRWLSFIAHLKLQYLPSVYSCHTGHPAFTGMFLINLCPRWLLSCVMSFLLFLN